MATLELDRYISERYKNWLDYAKYRCYQAGIPEQGKDVLNEVLCMLWEKEEDFLLDLMRKPKNGYTELDWFIVRMIELNAISPTSPYRYKTKQRHLDRKIDLQRLDVEDTYDEEEDRAGRILEQMKLVRKIYEGLELSRKSRQIFEYRFFHHEDFADWPGKESLKYLYDTFNRILLIIKGEIYLQGGVK